jgi:hypothetical protein
MIFDIEKAFENSGLSLSQIEKIKKEIRREFPDDEMMYELHVIRAIDAFKKGYWEVD